MFNQKKILVLITGKLRFLDQKNILRLKNSFENFKLDFFVLAWKGQKQNIIDEFKKHYKPIFYHEIDEYNFNHIVEKIKYPDGAVKTENILHMWKGISEAAKYLKKFYSSKNEKPFYILRYRSDILPKEKEKFLIEKELSSKDILIPDRYHWHGINDQVFLCKFEDIYLFENFDYFLDKHISEQRFFCSEYIFLRFLKKNNFKIRYNDFNYNIMRRQMFELNDKKNIKDFVRIKDFIPIKDLIIIKQTKMVYKFRNFKEYFITKTKRNNYQDIIIK